jgi:hypothetical protein
VNQSRLQCANSAPLSAMADSRHQVSSAAVRLLSVSPPEVLDNHCMDELVTRLQEIRSRMSPSVQEAIAECRRAMVLSGRLIWT